MQPVSASESALTFRSDAPAICALCRRPILPEPTVTSAEGLPYHGPCWDRRSGTLRDSSSERDT